MPKEHCFVYDTRFFVEHFYSKDQLILEFTRAEIDSRSWERLVSVITLHEFYRLNLERVGRDVALLRTNMIGENFKTLDVDKEIALRAAELRRKYSAPMGDSLIAGTTHVMQGICVTDDPHITGMKEIKSRWIP
jgi:predicted nucleic acid-binding protein